MSRRRILTAAVVVMVAVGILLSGAQSHGAFAAQTSTVGGNALKVSPVRQDITMDPGTSQFVDVFISNLTSVPAKLHGAVNDFTSAGNETGQPNIILDENQSAPTHSLKQFVVPVGDFTLAPGEVRDIKVKINIAKDAPGGGYYGAIRFYPVSTAGDISKNLNLSASVGSLVLLRVNGEIKEEMHVASFDVRRGDNSAFFFTSNKGLVNVIRFQNTGNVQLEPFGKIMIKRFGKVVSTTEINDVAPRSNVLPDSIRRFDQPLKGLSSFGKYTLQGNFGYGSTGQLLTSSLTFYIVPVAYIAIVLGIVLALAFLIFVVPRLIRAYNRNVIRKASRRR